MKIKLITDCDKRFLIKSEGDMLELEQNDIVEISAKERTITFFSEEEKKFTLLDIFIQTICRLVFLPIDWLLTYNSLKWMNEKDLFVIKSGITLDDEWTVISYTKGTYMNGKIMKPKLFINDDNIDVEIKPDNNALYNGYIKEIISCFWNAVFLLFLIILTLVQRNIWANVFCVLPLIILLFIKSVDLYNDYKLILRIREMLHNEYGEL